MYDELLSKTNSQDVGATGVMAVYSWSIVHMIEVQPRTLKAITTCATICCDILANVFNSGRNLNNKYRMKLLDSDQTTGLLEARGNAHGLLSVTAQIKTSAVVSLLRGIQSMCENHTSFQEIKVIAC